MSEKLLEHWNPEAALNKFLNYDLPQISLLKKWYESHDRGLVEEEWRPTRPTNFLVTQGNK